MWTQPYQPIGGSLFASAIVAALPLVAIGLALAVWRMPSWKASMLALATALVVALTAYGMPLRLAVSSAMYGAAFGLFPLGFLVYAAILLFDIVVASGRFEVIRRSLTRISPDERIQVLVIAFAFGAFLEGAAGSGTPVAVSASLLVGIGFSPLRASAVSLLANTAPVAFGALGLPIVTLATVTGLPLDTLSVAAGRIAPLLGAIVPAYLISMLSGARSALAVWPAVAVCGLAFGLTQFIVSNAIGPYLADIISALVTMCALAALLQVWRPGGKRGERRERGDGIQQRRDVRAAEEEGELPARDILHAWMPYLLLVAIVIIWGAGPSQRILDQTTLRIPVPGLHLAVIRTVPVVPRDAPYPAIFVFNWISAAGTACLLAALITAAMSGIGGRKLLTIAAGTARRLALSELTIALVVGLAFVLNYAGATATLGLATAATGRLFPFFSAYLGWLGVFLTGSDTSSNALFGPLQTVSALKLRLNPVLTAAVNACGGVMGKMVSVQSIAVAAAATGMAPEDEGAVFRLTLKHSLLLAGLVGLLAMMYAYALPGWIPTAPGG